MTVAELIEALRQQPQDAQVLAWDETTIDEVVERYGWVVLEGVA